MNYTKPNDPNHEDKPGDWLNSSLIFGRALSLMLEENTGIVVNMRGEMKNPINNKSDKVVVFYMNGMIHVDDIQDPELNEGDFISIVE